eukprot:GEMP01036644.1.p1 GENE.GEMP01036644.1~~GEMP01036644.1.p1  ORF type:complete len:158 (-),score=27.22 GEMP01036644.1:1331-1804(-)
MSFTRMPLVFYALCAHPCVALLRSGVHRAVETLVTDNQDNAAQEPHYVSPADDTASLAGTLVPLSLISDLHSASTTPVGNRTPSIDVAPVVRMTLVGTNTTNGASAAANTTSTTTIDPRKDQREANRWAVFLVVFLVYGIGMLFSKIYEVARALIWI